MRPVRVGTRASDLARWQTDHALGLWRALESGLEAEIVELSTLGDDLDTAPLEVMEGTGFFTSTLERALLEKRIDVAVHSYKDLPVAATAGLTIAAAPARGPVEDVLCARDSHTLRSLPAGAKVGTSSLRRMAQIRRLRTDLDLRSLRGNVPGRLARVARMELDGVVLAAAGVERLGLGSNITERFPLEVMLPAPAQGALAIQVREDDRELLERLASLEDPNTRLAVEAERLVLHMLRGGCSVPVGAHARVENGTVRLEAAVFDPADGAEVRALAASSSAERAGAEAARLLLERGARALLDAVQADAARWSARLLSPPHRVKS